MRYNRHSGASCVPDNPSKRRCLAGLLFPSYSYRNRYGICAKSNCLIYISNEMLIIQRKGAGSRRLKY